jgi:hypothetical protein
LNCCGEKTGFTDRGGDQFFDNDDNVSVHCGDSKTEIDTPQELNFDLMEEM